MLTEFQINCKNEKINTCVFHLHYINVFFSLQVLRSADRWSTGTCENSILKAYIHTIENSQHFIYIEVINWLSSCQFHYPNIQTVNRRSQSLKVGLCSFQIFMKVLEAKSQQKCPCNLDLFLHKTVTESLNAAIAPALLLQIPVTFPSQPGLHAEPPSALWSALRTSSSSAALRRKPYIMKLVMRL